MTGAYLWLYVVFTLIPVIGSVSLLFHSKAWQPSSKPWRKRLWLIGMSVVTVFSLTLLVALSLNALPDATRNQATNAFGYWLMSGAVLVPLATISIGFGAGRLRWLGFLFAALTGSYIFMSIAIEGVTGI